MSLPVAGSFATLAVLVKPLAALQVSFGVNAMKRLQITALVDSLSA